MQKIEHNSLCETESYKVMTDNEIIKALECCKEAVTTGCKDCPLGDYGTNTCITVLSETALDLINRLQAKNTLLESINKELSKSVDMLKLYDISNLKAEIERLQKAIKVQDIMIEQQDYKLKQAKSEAIKEFVKRLKENIYIVFEDTERMRVVQEVTIDNLVKEMTE